MYTRYLRSYEVSKIQGARDNAIEPPRGQCESANIPQGSVRENLDKKFGGEVQEMWRHGWRWASRYAMNGGHSADRKRKS